MHMGYRYFVHFSGRWLFAYDMKKGVMQWNKMTILTDRVRSIACFVVLTQN